MARGKKTDETAGPFDRINSDIGKRIRARRHELRMTQTDVARQVGVSQQQIVKYEKGIGRIPADTWITLSGLLQLDTAAFSRPHAGVDVEISGFAESSAVPFIVDAMSDRDTVALVRAFVSIDDKAVRKKVLDLVATLAAPPGKPKAAKRGTKGS